VDSQASHFLNHGYFDIPALPCIPATIASAFAIASSPIIHSLPEPPLRLIRPCSSTLGAPQRRLQSRLENTLPCCASQDVPHAATHSSCDSTLSPLLATNDNTVPCISSTVPGALQHAEPLSNLLLIRYVHISSSYSLLRKSSQSVAMTIAVMNAESAQTSLRRLITKLARLSKPRRPRCITPKLFSRSTSSEHRIVRLARTMADAEEDFSSLPLPDRFTHKVGNDLRALL
jgi:hypothetical protein